MIFDLETVRTLFLDILSRAKVKFGFRLENFCLMGNHFHMVIVPQEGTSLSRILQWILSVFAMAWNRINGLTGQGSVWGQRFFSRILKNFADYLHTFFYIEANPVTAGLVTSPGDWDYGSIGLRRRGWGWLLDDPPEELRVLR